MGTKLKNMSEQKKVQLSFWGMFTLATTGIGVVTSVGFYDMSGIRKLFFWILFLAVEALAAYAYLLWQRQNTGGSEKETWHWIPVEALAVAGVVVLEVMLGGAGAGPLGGEVSLIDYVTWRNRFKTSTLFYLVAGAVFQGIVLLILVKIQAGNLKNSSIVWKRYCMWEKTTPLEKRLKKEERAASVLFAVSAVVIIAGRTFHYWSGWGTEWILWPDVLGVIGIMAGVFLLHMKTKPYRDMGKLLAQIGVMEEGNLQFEPEYMEDPDIRRASEQLCDISKNLKKIMEKQMKAEHMKIELITNVSHDLKTPLTSMVGYIDLLKKEELSNEAKDYVDVLALKQEQLKQMIQDIFDLSKSASGEVELELEELDMKKLLEQTLGDMEDAINKSGMIIREKIGEEPLGFVGDGKKMYRVLQNLISNALKYSLKGTRIYIEAVREAGNVVLAIKNTSAYEMDFTPEEIMERFTRADKARNTEGHGLGLAIAEGFVKNMGGTFDVGIDGDQFKVKVSFLKS